MFTFTWLATGKDISLAIILISTHWYLLRERRLWATCLSQKPDQPDALFVAETNTLTHCDVTHMLAFSCTSKDLITSWKPYRTSYVLVERIYYRLNGAMPWSVPINFMAVPEMVLLLKTRRNLLYICLEYLSTYISKKCFGTMLGNNGIEKTSAGCWIRSGKIRNARQKSMD